MLAVSVVALFITAWMLFDPETTARQLGSSEHLLPMVVDYMVWYVPSWVFMVWTSVALFVIRLDGAPNVAMACSLVAAILNIILDWLFMFPFGWGVMGAAFATSISTAAGGVVAIVYLLFKAHHLRLISLRMSTRDVRLCLKNVFNQCRIGSSALLGEATMAVLMFMGNQVFMRYLGDDGVGAFGIACYYTPFVFMVGNAIAQSAQPIISYNLGLGLRLRMREAEKTALVTAIICGLIVTSLFVGVPAWLVGLFVDLQNGAAIIAVNGFPYFAIGFVGFIFNITAIGYFQSVERIRPATTFALMRGILILIPSFVLMPQWLDAKGIWLAMPVAEIVTAVTIMCFYKWNRIHDVTVRMM